MLTNRCHNTGLEYAKPFLSPVDSEKLRRKVDSFIDEQIARWYATVPYAAHFEQDRIDQEYYVRHLIETAWRIRLLRVSESKCQAEIAKISPKAAMTWARYEMEEMLHDELFIKDIEKAGVSRKTFLATEPYLATKLLTGFFSYLLDHEGPLGVVAYSYLVEYVNVKIERKKMDAMVKTLGKDKVEGQLAHAHIDAEDDHPGEVWECIHYLVRSQNDADSLFQYMDEHQQVLAMYFEEIYRKVVVPKNKVA